MFGIYQFKINVWSRQAAAVTCCYRALWGRGQAPLNTSRLHTIQSVYPFLHGPLSSSTKSHPNHDLLLVNNSSPSMLSETDNGIDSLPWLLFHNSSSDVDCRTKTGKIVETLSLIFHNRFCVKDLRWEQWKTECTLQKTLHSMMLHHKDVGKKKKKSTRVCGN